MVIADRKVCLSEMFLYGLLPRFHVIIEPTCAYYTVGLYASLSVCHAVRLDWTIVHISQSIRDRNLKFYHIVLRL